MTICPFFHIGVLVPDIHAARDRFKDLFEVDFTSVAVVEYDVAVPATAEVYHRVSHVCFSREGPPYYELLQVGSHGLFGPTELGRIHHVGVWTPDAAASQTAFSGKGVTAEAEILTVEGRTRVWYSDPHDAYGIRFEFQEESRRDWLERYIATGTAENAPPAAM